MHEALPQGWRRPRPQTLHMEISKQAGDEPCPPLSCIRAGHSVRLDHINRYGPIDAWVTLDTVTLTNTSQLYFGTSSIGQPARLYRLIQGP